MHPLSSVALLTAALVFAVGDVAAQVPATGLPLTREVITTSPGLVLKVDPRWSVVVSSTGELAYHPLGDTLVHRLSALGAELPPLRAPGTPGRNVRVGTVADSFWVDWGGYLALYAPGGDVVRQVPLDITTFGPPGTLPIPHNGMPVLTRGVLPDGNLLVQEFLQLDSVKPSGGTLLQVTPKGEFRAVLSEIVLADCFKFGLSFPPSCGSQITTLSPDGSLGATVRSLADSLIQVTVQRSIDNKVFERTLVLPAYPLPTKTQDSIRAALIKATARNNDGSKSAEGERLRQSLADQPVYHQPLVKRLLISGQGGLWIQVTTDDTTRQHWLVLGPDGQTQGLALLPARSVLHAVRDQQAYVIEEDTDGKVSLVRYRVDPE